MKFFVKNSFNKVNFIKVGSSLKKTNPQSLVLPNNLNMPNILLNYIFKSGLKKPRKTDLLNAFNYFFFVFFNKTLSWEGFDHQINILKHSFFKNTNYFDINYVLSWLSNFLNPVFEVVCYTVPKKYKKKLNKKYLFKLKYNYTPSRRKIALKWLHIYSNNFNDRSLSKRLLKSLFYTFVQGRESFLHKKKIQIYGKFLKKN